MSKKLFLTITALLLVASCGEQAEKVEPMKRGDKNLSCDDILLEVNEAEQYKKMAFEKKQLGVKSIVMPLGYIDTYMSADDAIEAANSRVTYLNKIYDIKRCDPKNSDSADVSDVQKNIGRVTQSPSQSGGAKGQAIGYQPSGQPIYAEPNYGRAF